MKIRRSVRFVLLLFMVLFGAGRLATAVQLAGGLHVSVPFDSNWTRNDPQGLPFHASVESDPAPIAALFSYDGGKLICMVRKMNLNGGHIFPLGRDFFAAYFDYLIGAQRMAEQPDTAFLNLNGSMAYQAEYDGVGEDIGYLLPEHRKAQITTKTLYGNNGDGYAVGLYFIARTSDFSAYKGKIDRIIRGTHFTGKKDWREASMLETYKDDGMFTEVGDGSAADTQGAAPTEGVIRADNSVPGTGDSTGNVIIRTGESDRIERKPIKTAGEKMSSGKIELLHKILDADESKVACLNECLSHLEKSEPCVCATDAGK